MKKIMKLAILAVSMTIFQCCSAEDPFTDSSSNNAWSNNSSNTSNMNNGGGNSGSSTAGSGELLTFGIAIDQTTAEPESMVEEYFPDGEDNLDNNSFETEVTINFEGTTANCSKQEGVTITTAGAHVVANHGSTKGICYVVSGTTTAGSLTIVGDKKYEVKLSGADITNPDSTALNLLSKKRAYLVIEGSNKLADGTTSKAEDQKAALYCKGKLLMNGNGQLSVYGNYNNAIHCADYMVLRKGNIIYAKSTANHGVKANDGIIINGGILNVEVSAAAGKGLNCESNIIVNGGRTTVITTGDGAYEDSEAKGAAAIKCDSTYTQNGGEVYLMSTGNGGKGLKTDYEAYITGGTLRVITSGSTYSYSRDTASPKGIKIGTKNVHGLLNISGGNIMVRTSGNGGEGIESKGTITISDEASVQVSAYDDAINSSGNMYIMGGNITAVGMNSDGLDANGNMYISGGSVVAFGAGGAESGIDTGEQYKLYITGGQVFGIGGRIDASYGTTNDSQAYAQASGSVSATSTVTLSNGTSMLATFTMPPYNYNNGTIMVSAPGMTSGGSYTLNLGSTSQTVSGTTTSSTGNMGGMPGGRW